MKYTIALCVLVSLALTGAEMLGYARGFVRANEIRTADENKLRIDMMSMHVCEWTQIYAEKMGCKGTYKMGDTIPHIPQ